MPMLASLDKPSHLVPPLDVAFVWLVHRLMPQAYEKVGPYASSKAPLPTAPAHDH